MSGRTHASLYGYGRWEADLDRRALRADGQRVPLGSKAFDIIEALIQAQGSLISKDELARRIWPNEVVDDNTLQVHISALRRALGADRDLIRTTSGRGYRLLGDWRLQPAEHPGGASTVRVAAASTGFPLSIGNLPVAASALIGREAARQQVAELASTHRVVTLVGPGGIGKTRLAVAVAGAMQPAFADGAWLVDLSPLSDARLVPSLTAATLGLDLGVTDVAPARVAQSIGGQQRLIVLDNCEHVIGLAAQMAETIVLLCPAVAIIATSQEPLRIAAEGVYQVPPLGVPADDRAAVAEPGEYSAVELFLARAQVLESHLEDRPAALAAIALICRRLDGIPLAIELAAARATTLGLQETIRHLDHRFDLLTEGRRTAAPRQRTLLATLDWSYGLLSDAERHVLQGLAVFSGGFTLDASCAVLATEQMKSADVVDAVSGLAARSLVVVQAIAGTTRYSLLETVRAYALDTLVASGEVEPVRRRHAACYLQLLQDASVEWNPGGVAEWVAIYGREIDNVRAALDWAFSPTGDAAIAVMLAAFSSILLFDLSLVVELHRRADEALLLIRAGVRPDPRCEMWLLAAQQATRIYTEGPSAAALEAWETVLQLATALDDGECQARALWGLWNDNLYAGSPAVALGFARRFAELAAAGGDPGKAILGYRLLGISSHYGGDQRAARQYLEQVLTQYEPGVHRLRTIGARLNHATVTRATLVRVLWLQGEADTALQLCEIAVRDALEAGHLQSTLYVLVEAALPHALVIDDLDQAGRFVESLLEQAGQSGFAIWQTYGRCFEQVLRIRRGDYSGGLPGLAAAIGELRSTGFCAHLSVFLGMFASGQSEAGQTSDALKTVNEALDWTASHAEGWYVPELLRIKAGLIRRMSSAATDGMVEALLRQAMALAHEQGAVAWELRAATSLARLLRQQGQVIALRAVLAPVLAGFTQGFDTGDIVAAKALLSELE